MTSFKNKNKLLFSSASALSSSSSSSSLTKPSFFRDPQPRNSNTLQQQPTTIFLNLKNIQNHQEEQDSKKNDALKESLKSIQQTLISINQSKEEIKKNLDLNKNQLPTSKGGSEERKVSSLRQSQESQKENQPGARENLKKETLLYGQPREPTNWFSSKPSSIGISKTKESSSERMKQYLASSQPKVRFAEEVQMVEISCRSSTDISHESQDQRKETLSQVHHTSPNKQPNDYTDGGALTSCSMLERIQEAKINNMRNEQLLEKYQGELPSQFLGDSLSSRQSQNNQKSANSYRWSMVESQSTPVLEINLDQEKLYKKEGVKEEDGEAQDLNIKTDITPTLKVEDIQNIPESNQKLSKMQTIQSRLKLTNSDLKRTFSLTQGINLKDGFFKSARGQETVKLKMKQKERKIVDKAIQNKPKTFSKQRQTDGKENAKMYSHTKVLSQQMSTTENLMLNKDIKSVYENGKGMQYGKQMFSQKNQSANYKNIFGESLNTLTLKKASQGDSTSAAISLQEFNNGSSDNKTPHFNHLQNEIIGNTSSHTTQSQKQSDSEQESIHQNPVSSPSLCTIETPDTEKSSTPRLELLHKKDRLHEFPSSSQSEANIQETDKKELNKQLQAEMKFVKPLFLQEPAKRQSNSNSNSKINESFHSLSQIISQQLLTNQQEQETQIKEKKTQIMQNSKQQPLVIFVCPHQCDYCRQQETDISEQYLKLRGDLNS